jgi:hypothetical protein
LQDRSNGAERPPEEAEAAMVKISSAQVSVITGGVLPEYFCERVGVAAWIEIRC